MRAHGALHQQLANALASSIRADEKSFKMGIVEQHEANWNVLAIDGHLEVCGGEKRRKLPSRSPDGPRERENREWRRQPLARCPQGDQCLRGCWTGL